MDPSGLLAQRLLGVVTILGGVFVLSQTRWTAQGFWWHWSLAGGVLGGGLIALGLLCLARAGRR